MEMFEATVNDYLWLFSSDELDAIRARANSLGRERVVAQSEEREPRCMMVWSDNEWENSDLAAEENISGFLNVNEEIQLKRWYETQMFMLCGRRTPVLRLRRSAKVTCTAVLLFKRFFLSNSIMEIDPVLVSLSALFSASKLEDEFADAAELARVYAADDEARAESLTTAIRAFEIDLLQGCNFDLRIAHPDRYFLALAESSDNLEAVQDAADALYLTDAPLLAKPEILALAAILFHRPNKSLLPPAACLMNDEMRAIATALAAMPELNSLYNHLRSSGPDDQYVRQANAAVKPLHKRLKKVALWRTTRESSSSATDSSMNTSSNKKTKKRSRV